MHPFFDPLLNKFRVKDNSSGSSNNFVILKKSLTAAQIRTGNSIPVSTGIVVPAGKYLHVIGASANYNQGDGAQAFTSFSLTTATKSDYQAILRATTITMQTLWGQFLIDATGNSFINGQDLMISTDADSVAGTGTADIYIIYILIDK